MSEERCYCVCFYYDEVGYVYTNRDTSGEWGTSYYMYDDDIPQSKLLTEEEAKRVARGMSRRYDSVSVSRVYS